MSQKGLDIVLKEKERRGLFQSTSSKKEIHIADKKQAEVCQQLYNNYSIPGFPLTLKTGVAL